MIIIKKWDKIIARMQRIPVWIWLTSILLISFLLKLLCWHFNPTVSRDGCLYIYLSQIWYETGSFQCILDAWNGFWLPPFPLYLMKSLMYTGLSAELAGIWLNLALGTFTPLLVYGITYETVQRKDIAICSALLALVNPSMNALSVEVQRDMIYLFFAGLALWLFVAGIRRQKWYFWCCAGLVCSCAMLTRFETVEFLVIVLLSLLLLTIGKFCSWKKTICYAGIFYLSFSVFLLTLSSLMQTNNYLFRNYMKYYQTKMTVMEKTFSTDSEKIKK